ARQRDAFDVEPPADGVADLAGRGAGTVQLVTDVVQHRRKTHVLHVDRHQLQRGVADEAEQTRQDQETDRRDAGLLAPAAEFSELCHWMLLPIRLHRGPPSLGARQFIQMRSALPTSRCSGTKSTPGKRLSRLLSRLSPIMK